MNRVRVGEVSVDVLSMDGALSAIESLVTTKRGGNVFTPNVDHVVQASKDARFREAYRNAALCVADGMPIVWASRLLGQPLPERVAGSDLFKPLMERAAMQSWRVFLLGAQDDVARAAEAKLRWMGVNVVGRYCGWMKDPTKEEDRAEALAAVKAADPDLVIVCMGAPKQELFMHHARGELGRAVAIGLGGTLDFFVGRTKRAPQWMGKLGLEWLYRLSQEPSRMWRRYLVRDPAFAGIVLRTLRSARATPALPATAG